MSDVTHILHRAQQGDPKAAEELLPLVYEEYANLRRRAWRTSGLINLATQTFRSERND